MGVGGVAVSAQATKLPIHWQRPRSFGVNSEDGYGFIISEPSCVCCGVHDVRRVQVGKAGQTNVRTVPPRWALQALTWTSCTNLQCSILIKLRTWIFFSWGDCLIISNRKCVVRLFADRLSITISYHSYLQRKVSLRFWLSRLWGENYSDEGFFRQYFCRVIFGENV